MDLKRYYEAFPVGAENTNLRYAATLPLLQDEGSLLDVGCDAGDWLQFLATQKENLMLSGVEVAPTSARSAQKKLGTKAKIIETDGDSLPFPDDAFDQVTILEVLEHVPDWQKVLVEAIRVTRRRIIITVPFNEKLKTTQCDNCGTVAPISGHVNSFRGDEFLPFAKRLTSIGSISQFYGIEHYMKRAYRGIARKIHKGPPQENKKYQSFETVCPDCYALVPYTEYGQRIRARLEKLLLNEPEILTVVIDK